MKKLFGWIVLAAVGGLSLLSASAGAQKINCGNEFRSGKLYFSQSIFDKSVTRFKVAVEACPDKGEYQARLGMAQCELGNYYLEQGLVYADTKEEQTAFLDSAMVMFKGAGESYDGALAAEPDNKKLRRFVEENRGHYWVKHYNLGIKLVNEKKDRSAVREFEIARYLDPNNVKSYSDGAVALINDDRKQEATELVAAGLELDPENAGLHKLRDQLFTDTGRSLVKSSEKNSREAAVAEGDAAMEFAKAAVADADGAIRYFVQVLESEGDDPTPDTMYDIGLGHLSRGDGLAKMGDDADTDAKAAYREAAEAFGKAASMTSSDEENREFHMNCMAVQAQTLLQSADFDEAAAVCRDYLSLKYTDADIWLIYAQALIQNGDHQEEAVAALTVNKALKGQKIDDPEAVGKDEEKGMLEEMGSPTSVYTFQEQGSGDQINVWFWVEKKKAVGFKLGLKSVEASWAVTGDEVAGGANK